MDSSTKKLLSGSMIYFLGNALTQLLSLLLLRFVTGRISPEEYGTYNLVVTVTNLVIPFFTIQIADAAFKFILAAKSDDEKKTYYTVSAGITVISSVLCIVAVYVVDVLIYDIPHEAYVALYIVFTSIYTIYQRIVRSLGYNKAFVVGNLIKTLVFLLLQIMLIYVFDLGVEALFIAVSASIICFLLFVELRVNSLRYLSINHFSMEALKGMAEFSLPLIPNAVFWWLTSSINTVIVSSRCGLDVNGIYTVANKFSSVLVMITTVFSMSWQESALAEYGDKRFRDFFTRTFKMYYVGVFSAIAVLIAFMHNVFPLMINASYHQSIRYAPFLLLASGVSSLAGFSAQVIMAKNQNKWLLFTNAAGMCINVLVVACGIGQFGLWAAVAGTLIAEVVIAGGRLFLVRREFTKDLKLLSLLCSSTMVLISFYLYFAADALVNAIWLLLGICLFAYINREVVWNLITILLEQIRTIGRRRNE